MLLLSFVQVPFPLKRVAGMDDTSACLSDSEGYACKEMAPAVFAEQSLRVFSKDSLLLWTIMKCSLLLRCKHVFLSVS